MEKLTNSLLRQKTDVGRFIRGENAYSVVKCTFQDNSLKPKNVTDVKLSVNILDSELISPIFQYQATVDYLIRDLISNHLIDQIEKEVELQKDALLDEGKEELSDAEVIFERMKRVEKHTADEAEDAKSKRYDQLAKHLMEKIENLRAEIDPEEFDALNIRENLKKIIDIENIRNRGYNTAINSITQILDTSKMGYQYLENMKNGRELLLREYEETDPSELPDERYQIRLKYYDNAQLIEERKAYDVQVKSLEVEVEHLWDVLEMVYVDTKFMKSVVDFKDLTRVMRGKIKRRIKARTGDPLYKDIEKSWDEISFVKPAETDVEKFNRTYVFEKDSVQKRLILMRQRLQDMYGYRYPIKRRVMEERLDFLENQFERFDYVINPYHIQPGLLLDVDITSIKRKKATLDGMANVLNEFLYGVSKGFQDAAFASFSRRRSTVREDIAQSFATGDEASASEQGADYLQAIEEIETPSAGPEQEEGGIVDSAPERKPKERKPRKSTEDNGLKEI